MVQRTVEADSPTPPAKMPTLKVPSCTRSSEGPDLTQALAALSVRAEFQGKVVLITGATGFVGSETLEQLLGLCPAVSKIYLLIRPKPGRSSKSLTGQASLKALLKSRALFREHISSEDALRAVLGKLVVVEGDVHKEDCGLSAADLERLRAEVDVVIHSAASISFFEHIHVLLQQNYQATREVAALAAGMQRLRAFIHISTCYVIAHRPQGSHIEEAIYPLVRSSTGGTLQHAELAVKLAQMAPGKAEKIVWTLYNTGCMDFHLFFCCTNIKALSGLLPAEERQSVRPLWQAETDSWADYMHAYMTAIRAKYFGAYDKVEATQVSVLHKAAAAVLATAVLAAAGLAAAVLAA